MRSKRGITLVSLVVTIIVLIILAGVSINLTLGENGIITMAKRARENMELAKVDEEKQLNELYMQMEQEGLSGEISYDAITKLIEFKREIASAITDMGIDTPENANASTMSRNIRNLTGASSADKVSYDNTNSGLTSTNMQGAVDEIDSEIDELNDSLTVYSIEEKVVGTWIDGKTIYRKSFDTTLGDSTESKTISTIENIDTCVSIKGYIIGGSSGNNSIYPLPWIKDDYVTECSVYQSILRCSTTNSKLYGRRIFVTVEYTKTN